LQERYNVEGKKWLLGKEIKVGWVLYLINESRLELCKQLSSELLQKKGEYWR
jgi:hypothetical protein